MFYHTIKKFYFFFSPQIKVVQQKVGMDRAGQAGHPQEVTSYRRQRMAAAGGGNQTFRRVRRAAQSPAL